MCGSYRRNKDFSNYIDILIFHSNYKNIDFIKAKYFS